MTQPANQALPPLDTRRWTGQDWIVIIGLGVLVSLAFYEVVYLGRVFFFRDFALFFYPKRVLAAEAIRQWRVPLWESYGGCGTPLLGSYQAAVFYPLSLIYYLLPMPRSFMVFCVAHFFISGAGAYYLMRAWGARRIGAAFAAFAWAFSPAFVSTVDNVSFQTSLAWLPWCLAFTKRIYQGRGAAGFVWLAVAFALAVLAGAPEPVIFAALTIAGYAVARLVGDWRARGLRAAVKPAALTAAALVVGVLLAGVEVGPFLAALRESPRQARLDVSEAGMWSAKPSDALLWFLPRFYLSADRGGIYWRSQFWLKSVYIGAMVPMLALWTSLIVRRRRNLFFLVVAVAGVALALGSHSFVWLVLYKFVPGFALIRYPIKFYLPAVFAITALAGFAVDDVTVLARCGGRGRLRLLFGAMLVVAAVFAIGYGVTKIWEAPVFKAVTPRTLLASEEGIDQAVDQFESARWSFGRSALVLAGGLLALLVAAGIARRRIPRPYGGLALALVLFADLVLFGAHLNPVAGPQIYDDPPTHLPLVPHGVADHRAYMDAGLQLYLSHIRLDRVQDLIGLVNYLTLVRGKPFDTPEALFRWLDRTSAPIFQTPEQLDEWLKAEKSTQFTTDIEYEVLKETFTPNINLMYHVPMSDTFEPLGVKRHDDIVRRLKNGDVGPGRERFLPYMWASSVVIGKQDVPPMFGYGPLEPSITRAVLADRIVPVDSDGEALSTLVYTDIDVTRRVILERDAATAARAFLGDASTAVPPDDAPPPGTASITIDTGNVTEFDVDAARKSLVLVSDAWYPLFRATVDGRPAPLWRANYAYRAVPVDEGRHKLRFTYVPWDLYAGLAMTLVALAVLVAAWRMRRA